MTLSDLLELPDEILFYISTLSLECYDKLSKSIPYFGRLSLIPEYQERVKRIFRTIHITSYQGNLYCTLSTLPNGILDGLTTYYRGKRELYKELWSNNKKQYITRDNVVIKEPLINKNIIEVIISGPLILTSYKLLDNCKKKVQGFQLTQDEKDFLIKEKHMGSTCFIYDEMQSHYILPHGCLFTNNRLIIYTYGSVVGIYNF
jgi:hypothetical protein